MVDELIVELIQDNFVNEERFASAYVRGKFRIKKWGRNKIKSGLYKHKLSNYVLNKAFAEIDDEQYLISLETLLEKRAREEKEKNPFLRKKKLAYWLIRKGYESDLVWDKLNED